MNAALRGKIGLLLLVPTLLFGVFVGGLMTWHHDTQLYGAAEQGQLIGCQESATVNCDVVNTSAWSELGGVPIGALAIAAYASVLVLTLDALRGREASRALVVIAGVIAVLCSAWLFYVSKVELGYICAWCLRLYGVNLAILALPLLGGRPRIPDRNSVVLHGLVFAGLVLVATGAERLYRAGLTEGPGPSLAAVAEPRAGDPEGPAPALSFPVKTEDARDATLTIEPDDAWTGNREASVAVVLYGDLECGYCKRSSAELARLEATYGDRVLFVFKHFPMDPACNPGVKNKKHRSACLAAKAAICAQRQRVFWEFHDLAYKNQHQLGVEYLRTYAERAGADVASWDACMATDEPMDAVRADAAAGAALDIHGTPRIFVNGKLYRSGSSAEVMARAIEVALGADPAAANASASVLREGPTDSAPVAMDTPATRRIEFGGLSFAIDTFEATTREGAAVSARHEVPALRTSWFDAKSACEKAGKRMCTEEEWVTACQGARAVDDNNNGELADDMIEGTAYPYGDFHEDGRCWDNRLGDAFRPVYTGESPGCVTPSGVYDLTGNVEEWAGDSPESAVLLGGAWDTSEDHARCYRRNDSFGAGYASVRTGYRCCSL